MKSMILIIDGLGDRPLKELGNKTPLELANTPNMDKMAKKGINGIMDPISPGIIPGSDTAHLSILGYDPYEVYTGRGPFEASGVGVDILPGDIAFRCNLSTLDENGIITDRRAGRIRAGNEEIMDTLNQMKIEGFEDIELIFKASTGHRAVLVLRGKGLSDKVSDADPGKDGNKPLEVVPLDESIEAKKTAELLNKLVMKSYEMLKEHDVNIDRINKGKNPANIIIPRGVGAVPNIEKINDKYDIKSACIAETGLIKGIGKLVGMDVVDVEGTTGGTDTDLDNIASTIEEYMDKDYNFLLVNIDGADEAAHDGNAEEKTEFLEKVDSAIANILERDDFYIVLTGDHSTPISKTNHTGDPVPIIINGPEVRTDDVMKFGERYSYKGGLCRIRGGDVMNIIMDLMNNTEKFGA